MWHAAALARSLPLGFLARLAIAFTEIALSAVVLCSSVIVGHELKAWRDWYYDPATTHPWAPTAKPSPALVAIAPPVPNQSRATPAPAPISMQVPPAAVAAWTQLCRPARDDERLVFVQPFLPGADCVRTAQREDGIHLVIDRYPGTSADYGVIARGPSTPDVRVFAPKDWANPVLVVTGARSSLASSLMVITWQAGSSKQLFLATGTYLDVGMDAKGWPRLTITTMEGGIVVRTYMWNGSAFEERS